MTVGELRVRWAELYGEETRSRNRRYLWRRLAWRIQELQLGGLPETAKARMLVTPAAFRRSQVPPHFVPAENGITPPGSNTHREPRLPSAGSTAPTTTA